MGSSRAPRRTESLARRAYRRDRDSDETFELTASAAHSIGVVVADVDAYGLASSPICDGPLLRLIATRASRLRGAAVRAGATLALPRNTPARKWRRRSRPPAAARRVPDCEATPTTSIAPRANRSICRRDGPCLARASLQAAHD